MSYTYNTRDAIATQPQNFKLKFEVEEVPAYKRTRRVGKKSADPKGGLIFSDEVVEVGEAWNVYFPSGHSIRIESKQEMIRLGYMDPPPVVDMETGEEVPGMDNLSPKQIVQRNTHRPRGALN